MVKQRKRKQDHKGQSYALSPEEISARKDEFLSGLPAGSEDDAVKCVVYERPDGSRSAEIKGITNVRSANNDQEIVFEDEMEDIIEDPEENIVNEDEVHESEEEDEQKDGDVKRVWHPGMDEDMETGDYQLDYDSRAYKIYHKMNLEWPCLSFDIFRDTMGQFRTKYPLTAFFVTGTQAESANKNVLSVVKVSELHKTKYDDADSDEDSDSDVDLDTDPVLEERSLKHEGGVNRIRSAPQASNIVATWADTGKVHVWDVKPLAASLDPENPSSVADQSNWPQKPLFTFKGHGTEGFSMDWSSVVGGRLITGDCNRNIYLWEPQESSGSWIVEKSAFKGHSASVEDLQWSPTERDVFASCSADCSIRIWDCRVRRANILQVENAHPTDVNVLSWNKSISASHLLASGSDDGSFKIWDLRAFKNGQSAGHFKWHSGPVTSLEWHPQQESVIAVSSADDSSSIWDMGLEADPEAGVEGADLGGLQIPPQLLFVHRGQKDVKELHFHPQIPNLLISTAADGFNLFIPDNL